MSRSIRDAVKEHQQARQEAPAAKPTQTPLTLPRGATPAKGKPPCVAIPPKQKPPVVDTHMVVAKCGHEVPFEIFPDAQDKFRDRRRAKLVEKACGPCRQAANNKRQEEERANRKPKFAEGGRLPHGSVMHAEYDGEKQQWSGSLTADKGNGFKEIFVAVMSGLFPLYRNLDLQYRAWEARRKGGADGNA